MIKKVAILLSVYISDDLEILRAAVESMLDQSYPNFALYIYLDGAVHHEVKQYLIEISGAAENVFLIDGLVNRGLAYGLNVLIDQALADGSDYMARMDSDDISMLDRLERQVSFLEKNTEVDVLGGFCTEFGSEFALLKKIVPLTHQELMNYSVARCPMIHPTVMFRARVFQCGLRYPINSLLSEDIAFWHKLMLRGYIFQNLDIVLLRYRLNENTISRRIGLSKALAEFKLRFAFMIQSGNVSIKNISLIVMKFFFHLLPRRLVVYAYRNFR